MSNVYIIELGHLASQAFAMTQQENPWSSRFISLAKLNRLGKEATGILKRQGRPATLFLCKELTNDFFRQHHDLFRKAKMGGENGMVLKQDVPFGILVKRFPIPDDVRHAFQTARPVLDIMEPFPEKEGDLLRELGFDVAVGWGGGEFW